MNETNLKLETLKTFKKALITYIDGYLRWFEKDLKAGGTHDLSALEDTPIVADQLLTSEDIDNKYKLVSLFNELRTRLCALEGFQKGVTNRLNVHIERIKDADGERAALETRLYQLEMRHNVLDSRVETLEQSDFTPDLPSPDPNE